MLDQLESLTASLSTYLTDQGQPPVMFGYGTSAELNVLADKVGASFLLFHDGYTDATDRVLLSGALETTHILSISLFSPSKLSDAPEDKRALMDLLLPIYKQMRLKIDMLGQVNNAKRTMNYLVNLTDRNLTGINLKLLLTTDAESLC